MLSPLNNNETLNISELSGHPKSTLGGVGVGDNNRKHPESERARTSLEPA